MQIIQASFEDLEEILTLQHFVFEIKARHIGNFELPALTQKKDGIIEEFKKALYSRMLKMV